MPANNGAVKTARVAAFGSQLGKPRAKWQASVPKCRWQRDLAEIRACRGPSITVSAAAANSPRFGRSAKLAAMRGVLSALRLESSLAIFFRRLTER